MNRYDKCTKERAGKYCIIFIECIGLYITGKRIYIAERHKTVNIMSKLLQPSCVQSLYLTQFR